MSDSLQPRVHQATGGGNCTSYRPGHNTHWIPAIRKYVSSPRQEVAVHHSEGFEFEVTFEGKSHRWFFHDPDALCRFIAKDATNFLLVVDTSFINFNWNREVGGVVWFYMDKNKNTSCIQPDLEAADLECPNL